jgi:FAD/FMN-containing dehydrogenase
MNRAGANQRSNGGLIEGLTAICGDGVVTDEAERRYFAQDLFSEGRMPVAIVSPTSAAMTADLVRFCRRQQVAIFARGGGMSYTRAFQPTLERAVVLDFARLDRVREIAPALGHVTVEAGCTWARLDAALADHGLRARFWGPMSGRTATVGGSLSQGAVTFGSGTAGASATVVKSFEIVTGTGEILLTGSDALDDTSAFNRHFGPDLTGLFTNDAGALGIKTAATLAVEPRPERVSGLSFAYDDFDALAALFHEVALRRLASELIAMDGDVARQNAGPASLAGDLQAIWRIGRAAGTMTAGFARMMKVALGGRRFLDRARYTAHFVVEGRDTDEIRSRVRAIRALARAGAEIVNTVPLMTRAHPFPELPVTHPDGRRMLPIHAMFALPAARAFHRDYVALKVRHAARMANVGVTLAEFFAGIADIGLLYEPVFFWPDRLEDYHRRRTPDAVQPMLQAYPANPDGYRLVEELVAETIALMRRHGGTHFQIGRLYPYLDGRAAASTALVRTLKQALDPDGIINPGALGL